MINTNKDLSTQDFKHIHLVQYLFIYVFIIHILFIQQSRSSDNEPIA